MAKKVDYSKILRGGDNKPTKPELWEKAKAAAKAKFDVYPSAVANAWASRYYADKGGDWKKMAEGGEVTITPDEMNLVRRRSREFGELYPITYPTGRQEGAGPDIAGLGKEALEAYSQSDRARAPEFFEEGSEIESRLEPTEAGGQTFVFPDSGLSSLADLGAADGGMVGSMANIATAIGKQQESPFPEITQVGMPMENTPSAKIKDVEKMAKGGYVVTRSNERKGKTHKVTGPDGSVKFFGDPNLKNRPNNPEAKASWYARHAKSLKANPHFRAYARSTWAEGGMVPDEIEFFQEGGISGEGQGVQTPVTRELLASAEPFPNRTSGDEDFLPLPEDLEEAPAAPVDVTKLSEEEKKKIIERQKADAEASGVPFTAQSPVSTAPASPVTVVVANQPVTPAPVAEPVAAAPTEPSSPELKGILEEVDTLRFASEKDYEKKIKDIQERAKKLSGADRAAYGNALSGVQTARAELERFTTRGVPAESKGRSPLGLLRKEVARAEQYGEQGYAKYQEIRKRALEQLGGLEELLEDTPKNARANAEITRNNTFRSEAANRIADEIVAKSTSAIGGEKATVPARPQVVPIVTRPTAAVSPAEPVAPAPAAPIAPVPAPTAPVADTAAPTVTTPVTTPAASPVTTPKAEEVPPELAHLVVPLEQLAERSFGIKDPAAKREFAVNELKRSGAITPTGAITPSVIEEEKKSTEYLAAAEALENERQAMLYKAELDAAAAKVKADVNAKVLDLQAKQEQEYEIRSRANAAQAQQLREAIIGFKVDPNRLWSNMSTGSKVATGISLLLGVIGKGLGGRGSVADFLQARIDEDVQQQYKDLDKKRSLLGNLIQEGHSIDDAFKMTTAYLKQIAAAQIEQQSAGIAEEQAKVAAAQVAAKFQLDAAKTLNDILIKNLDKKYGSAKQRVNTAGTNAIKVLDLARINRDYDEMERKRKEALGKKGIAERRVGVAEAAEKRKAEESEIARLAKDANDEERKALSGELVKTTDIPSIRKAEVRDRLVPVYDPKTGRAHPVYRQAAYSPKDAEKLRDTQVQVDDFMSNLAVLKELSAKYPNGIMSEILNPADYRRAKDAEDAIIPLLGKITDLGVLQKSDYDILRSNIPSLTQWRPLVGQESTAQALKDYENRFSGAYISRRNALLINPLAQPTAQQGQPSGAAKKLFRPAGE